MLILLDIDGVMVPASNWKRPEFESDGFPKFSRRATDSLQKIISETGAEILLTTSHKSKYSIQKWNTIFSVRGFKNAQIKRLKTNVDDLNRKEEVMLWWRDNDEKRFVIIDDDKSLNSLPNEIKSKLVQPSATVGLNEELADSAIRILKSSK
ncbi:hypothetical protein GWK08_08790 [Leptobacterium flavescens]|uniref:FCP1 homology domain-containing protein n=1 Tax=Leptobacterium flavescens TaxID=472055 RepID=A0A6P0UM66_9FLAO|nr:HAD domain-containing protein [Leptobacterium flavescens]NER13530.1 hypothetical protein [Leptobacterium flavescens]